MAQIWSNNSTTKFTMNKSNRSLKRNNKPIIELVTPNKQPHIVGVKVVCGCSDFKEREVIMDSKLATALMGFIKHRQGGTLQLSEGIPMRMPIKMEASPVSGEKEGDKYNGYSPESE